MLEALESSLACDEADKFADTLLNCLLSVFCNLSIGWKGLLHYPADICNGKESVLLSDADANIITSQTTLRAHLEANTYYCCMLHLSYFTCSGTARLEMTPQE